MLDWDRSAFRADNFKNLSDLHFIITAQLTATRDWTHGGEMFGGIEPHILKSVRSGLLYLSQTDWSEC